MHGSPPSARVAEVRHLALRKTASLGTVVLLAFPLYRKALRLRLAMSCTHTHTQTLQKPSPGVDRVPSHNHTNAHDCACMDLSILHQQQQPYSSGPWTQFSDMKLAYSAYPRYRGRDLSQPSRTSSRQIKYGTSAPERERTAGISKLT